MIAFFSEPTDPDAIGALKKAIMRGEVPDLPADLAVPLGKAIVRRPGRDVTVVAWGRAVWTCMNAAEKLAKEGIELEVVDLRTLVPPDMELVCESVGRTGRLLVAAEDRTFSGFVRQIQGDVVERMPGVPAKALGQKYVPGIAQNLALEEAVVLTGEDVVHGAHDVLAQRVGVGRTRTVEVAPRYFLT